MFRRAPHILVRFSQTAIPTFICNRYWWRKLLPAVFGGEVDIFQMGGYQVASGWRKTSHGFHKDFLGEEYKNHL